MENVTKIEEKKQNVFKRFGAWYKKMYNEHPVATVTGTVVTAVVTTAAVGCGIHAIYKATHKVVPVEEAVAAIPDSTIDPPHFDDWHNLPDSLGFDKMKLINEKGEILADSILDYGEDWVLAADYDAENIIREIGDTNLVSAIVNKIEDEAAAAAQVAEEVVEATI